MRDLLDILAAVDRLDLTLGPAVLATVVRVEGSSYRLPGARMLIDAAGTRTGSVSGGCLEADVARRGRLLTDDEPNTLVRYDGSDEDAAWGFGLGCNGSVEVFIQRTPTAALGFIRTCIENRTPGVLVTVFKIEGEDHDCHVGGHWTFREGEFSSIPDAWRSSARDCLTTKKTTTIVYETATARVHALVEYIRPPVPLVIFGAGHDAVPLVRAAKQLGWHVTVCDRRPGYARPDRFPLADAVVACDLSEMSNHVDLTPDTVALTMTHHYPDDRVLLEMLLQSPARYIGALGPLARTQRILDEITATAVRLTPKQLDRLHAPVGLDVGAEGPDQVALAVVAEILATLNDRPGAPLGDRVGPIHEPAHTQVVRASDTRDAQSPRKPTARPWDVFDCRSHGKVVGFRGE